MPPRLKEQPRKMKDGSPRPVLLDLFCGAGGAAMGYHRAGFAVVGIDLHPQPRYPFRFFQGDALQFCARHGVEFDCIHASPPCQAYSSLRRIKRFSPINHPDLVGACRYAQSMTGRPWIMENVVGAPLIRPVMLCGSAFDLSATCADGLTRGLRRHRLFESSFLLFGSACNHKGEVIGVYGNGGGHSRRSEAKRINDYRANVVESRAVMGISWMTRKELGQSIPPAYTEFLGRQLMAHVRPEV